MKIVQEYPPNFSEIKSVLNPDKSMIYCLGDTIYNPSGGEVFEDILVHEKYHEKQQKEWTSPEIWWTKYLLDKVFREEQEIEAFAAQYAYVRNHSPKASVLYECLQELAGNLSTLYRVNLSFGEASSKIRNKAKGMI